MIWTATISGKYLVVLLLLFLFIFVFLFFTLFIDILWSFKADVYPAKFWIFPCARRFLADRKKMQHYRGFGCIYAHKNENLQKNRVSATSCVFEYYISNIKNQKRKKLRENWNSLHNLVLLVGFLIFHVLVCQLVGQKKWKKGTSVFYLQDRDYR